MVVDVVQDKSDPICACAVCSGCVVSIDGVAVVWGAFVAVVVDLDGDCFVGEGPVVVGGESSWRKGSAV